MWIQRSIQGEQKYIYKVSITMIYGPIEWHIDIILARSVLYDILARSVVHTSSMALSPEVPWQPN